MQPLKGKNPADIWEVVSQDWEMKSGISPMSKPTILKDDSSVSVSDRVGRKMRLALTAETIG